jgi:hypothetical protein
MDPQITLPTLARMQAEGRAVAAHCVACGRLADIQLAHLIARFGADIVFHGRLPLSCQDCGAPNLRLHVTDRPGGSLSAG